MCTLILYSCLWLLSRFSLVSMRVIFFPASYIVTDGKLTTNIAAIKIRNSASDNQWYPGLSERCYYIFNQGENINLLEKNKTGYMSLVWV